MSISIQNEDIPNFRIWLFGKGFKQHKLKGEYETLRMAKANLTFIILYRKKEENGFRTTNTDGELLWMEYLQETNK